MPHSVSSWSMQLTHKWAHKQFAEDKQPKNWFGLDGVQHVWCYHEEEHQDTCVLLTVKHGVVRGMVSVCMKAAGTGKLQFIEGKHVFQYVMWYSKAENDTLLLETGLHSSFLTL